MWGAVAAEGVASVGDGVLVGGAVAEGVLGRDTLGLGLGGLVVLGFEVRLLDCCAEIGERGGQCAGWCAGFWAGIGGAEAGVGIGLLIVGVDSVVGGSSVNGPDGIEEKGGKLFKSS